MKLRDYQTKAIESVLGLAIKGRSSACLVMPPGGGKTITGIGSAMEIARGGPVLWVAHRKELIKQASNTLETLGYKSGIIAPWAKRQPDRHIQVGSVQTLRAIGTIPPSAVVVWDECHHAMGEDWNLLAQQVRAMKAFLLGLTATPQRSDGKGLSPTFSNLVVAATQKLLLKRGYLVPTDVFVPDRYISDGVADVPVTLWEKHAPNTKTVVFCSSVEHSIAVSREFSARGYSAAFVDGTMSNKDRDSVISRFVNGRIDVICNCQILTEGFDLPPVETVVLARSVGSVSLYLQMVGRGSRPFRNKKRNSVLDLVGNALVWGLPDEDREYSLRGKPICLKNSDSDPSRRLVRCQFCGAMVTPVQQKKRTRSNTCPVCSNRIYKTKEVLAHGKRLSKLSSSEQASLEKATLDRLTAYAREHFKNREWIVERFVKKFGRTP